MNGTALTKTDLAAWQSLLARPDGSSLLIAALFYLASSLMIPHAATGSAALIFLFVCAAFYYMQTRRLAAMILPAIPVMVLFTASGTLALPAAFVAIVFGSCGGAILLLGAKTAKEKAPLALLPLSAYGAAVLLGASPLVALLALLPLPCAVVGAVAVRRCTAFTSAVLALSLAIGGGLLAALLTSLAVNGLLDLSLLPSFIDAVGDTLIATLDEAIALYAEAGVTIELSETAIRNLLASLVNLSPAIFALCAMITAYFIWRTLAIWLVSFGVLPRLPRLLVLPTMSVTAAVLFLLATLVAFIADAKTATPVGAVAQNLALILEPGLALVGVGSLLFRRATRSCLSLVALAVLVYLVWSNPAAALALAAFYGALLVLFDFFQTLKNKGDT